MKEVEDRTKMLLTHHALDELRKALKAEGYPPETLLMGGFVEDEEEHEYGAVVTRDGRVFEYERDTRLGATGFMLFQEMTADLETVIGHFPAVEAALYLVGKSSG